MRLPALCDGSGYATLFDVAPSVSEAAGLIGQWDFPRARAVLDELLAGTAPDDPELLPVRLMLAEVLRELGEAGAAAPLAAQAVAHCRLHRGADDPLTVRAAAVLGTILHDLGHLDGAERHYLLAVHSGATVDGPAGRAVLLAEANLALLHRDRGDPVTAQRDLAAAYATSRRVFGGTDPDTLRLGTELGKLYRDRGDLPAARRQLAGCHTTACAALGPAHPVTAGAASALASLAPAGLQQHAPPAPPVRIPAQRPPPGDNQPLPTPAPTTTLAARPRRIPTPPRLERPIPRPVDIPVDTQAEPLVEFPTPGRDGAPLRVGRLAAIAACLGVLLAGAGTAVALTHDSPTGTVREPAVPTSAAPSTR